MSEPKKLEELLESMNKDLQDLKQWKNAHSQSTESSTSSKPPHTHRTGMGEHVEFDCPECQTEYNKKVSAEAVKAYKEKIKSMKSPELCEDCGEIFDGEGEEGEEETCPTCHGRTEE